MPELDNLNPHAERRFAIAWWGEEYAAQRVGCMDFWAGLDAHRQHMCTRVVDEISKGAKKGVVTLHLAPHNASKQKRSLIALCG